MKQTAVLALLVHLLSASPSAGMAPSAIVYALQGETSCTNPEQPRRPLRLFDRLPAGAVVTVGKASHLDLAFASGRRWTLGAGAQVTIGRTELASRSGDVRPLPSVPPLPRLAPIAMENRPGPRAGAVRIRSERMTGLYPRKGVTVIAGAAGLHFQRVEGAKRYRIEVQDGQGGTVFETETESPPVAVPAGKLLSGRRYTWTVRTLDRPGGAARGEAEIVTLDEHTARVREEARRILAEEGPDALPLLAEIDRSLGLLLESRQDLQAALSDKLGDPALQEALAEIETYLQSP